jgi:phosphoglycolate phosphatase
MKYSTLIFDLDGTLSNPLAGMAESINHALVEHGYAEREIAEIATFVGPPLEGTLVQIVGSDDSEHINRIVQTYRQHYLIGGFSNNHVYDGIGDLLEALKQSGVRIGVCTSKPKRVATKILAHFNLLDYFVFVSGGDVGIKKGQQLEQLLSDTQIDNQAVMIGDRNVDVVAAQQNGLDSAGVLWGFGDEAELSQAGATHLIKAPQELLGLA